jgi:hypothetical protein
VPDAVGRSRDRYVYNSEAGRHSSITISQRYVRSTAETIELAFDRLEKLNPKALEASKGKT